MFSYEEYEKIRNEKGMKDADVCRITGFSQSTFSDWKKKKSFPKSDKLLKIAAALECDPSVFLSAIFGHDIVYKDGKTEAEMIMELYIKADDQSKDIVRRILKYTEGMEKQ